MIFDTFCSSIVSVLNCRLFCATTHKESQVWFPRIFLLFDFNLFFSSTNLQRQKNRMKIMALLEQCRTIFKMNVLFAWTLAERCLSRWADVCVCVCVLRYCARCWVNVNKRIVLRKHKTDVPHGLVCGGATPRRRKKCSKRFLFNKTLFNELKMYTMSNLQWNSINPFVNGIKWNETNQCDADVGLFHLLIFIFSLCLF